MKNSIGNHFENLSQDTKEALNHTLNYYKLDLFKKTALSLISGGQFVLKIGVLILVLLFISLGLAFLIGNHLGSVSYGFFIVGGAYIILLIIISLIGRKLLERPILMFLNSILHSGDKLEEEIKKYSQPESSEK